MTAPSITGGYVNYVNGVPVGGASPVKRLSSPTNRQKDGHGTASKLPTIARNQPVKDARLSKGISSHPTRAMLLSKSHARAGTSVKGTADSDTHNISTRASKKLL